MKLHILAALAIIVCAGCTSTKPRSRIFNETRGIAWKALDIEDTEWRRDEARIVLTNLLRDISRSVATSGSASNPIAILAVIDNSILKAHFHIGNKKIKTFGDSLTAHQLDCSDLSLIYMEAMGNFVYTALPVFGRGHVFISVTNKNGIFNRKSVV